MKRALCAERTIPSCQRKIDDPAAAQTGQGASVPPLPVALPSDLHMQSFGGTSQPRHQAIGGRIKRELNIEPGCLRRGIERGFYPVATRHAPSTQRPCFYLKLDMPVRKFRIRRKLCDNKRKSAGWGKGG